MTQIRPLIGKAIIEGTILCRSGLHIGGSESALAIGGVDSAVIRDPLTNRPYIPGSSLKGKLRSLLERALSLPLNRSGGGVSRHECNDGACPVCRLFGAAVDPQAEKRRNIPSRLIVGDAFLNEDSAAELEEIDGNLPYTEEKTENGLDRLTCAATPRQIERVPAGARFDFRILYTVENNEEAAEDLDHLKALLRLLEDDALGGGGSRGNGRVSISIGKVLYRSLATYLGNDAERELDAASIGESLAETLAEKKEN